MLRQDYGIFNINHNYINLKKVVLSIIYIESCEWMEIKMEMCKTGVSVKDVWL